MKVILFTFLILLAAIVFSFLIIFLASAGRKKLRKMVFVEDVELSTSEDGKFSPSEYDVIQQVKPYTSQEIKTFMDYAKEGSDDYSVELDVIQQDGKIIVVNERIVKYKTFELKNDKK